MIHREALRRSLLLVSTLAFCGAAHGQLFRTYVASDGNDTNPCTLPQPCRLLPAALAAVANGGEVWMLDSANYNGSPVGITKSVTILAVPGAVGSVLAIGGNAINIGTAGVKVALRNLVIVPFPGGGGTNGVVMTNGDALSLEGCSISGLVADSAVRVSTPARVRVSNSVFRDNYVGVHIQGGAKVAISNSTFHLPADGYGIDVYGADPGPTSVAVSDTVVSGGQSGIAGWDASATSKTHVSITRSTISNNQFGVGSTSFAGGTVVVSIGDSMVTGNNIGLSQINMGSIVESLGNNLVRQNTTNNSQGTITPVAPM